MALFQDPGSGPQVDGIKFEIDSNSSSDEDDDADVPTPCQTPTGEEAAAERRRGLLSRIAFLEAEAEKLMEHSRGCLGHAAEMQALLARLDDQKAALQRLLGTENAGPELDPWDEPCDLTEHTARTYLLWLRRLLHDLSQAVDLSASGSAAPASSSGGSRLSSRRRRDAPNRIFPNLEALDIAAVANEAGDVFYRPGEEDDLSDRAPAEPGWETLPRQTLYCVVGDGRQVAVVGLGGQLLARARLTGGSDEDQAVDKDAGVGRNLERINHLRCSGWLLFSDYQSLYICDRCCRVLRSLHGFSWMVGHCVDEPADRLYIVDRVNEFVSVYGLASLEERGRLAHRDFTDGISSVCTLAQTLFVSDRGANAIFAFSVDSLELAFRVPLRNPLFVTTDWSACLYVTVGGRDNTVRILDTQGQLRRSLSGGRGSQPGQFGSPGGLTVSLDGAELFVCDLDNRRVQVFRL